MMVLLIFIFLILNTATVNMQKHILWLITILKKPKKQLKKCTDRLVMNLFMMEMLLSAGLIIRHLILPNDLSDTEKVFKFIAEELSPKVHISLMSQYYPTNKAYKDILIDRALRNSEYNKALQLLDKYGLHNGWIQEMESSESYRPNFNEDRLNPFKI